ncbi:MAG: PKD domain-containing protein [Flavobacteriales bacterium]|jgi:hypothetical protein|nr:PKD domain-containing protein [Flavobacteriales bacterium]
MRNTFLTSFFLFFGFLVVAQESKSILFIGNSYTFYHNLPDLTKQIALSYQDTLEIQSHTPGGAPLQQHATNQQLTQLINSKNWDFVSIQAQSQEPSFPTGQFMNQTYPYAVQLVNTIKDNNECTEPVFFMTWGRKNGDANNCAVAPWLCTYEGMDDSLRARYTFMANNTQSLISPVGAVWRYLRDNNTGIELYSPDESHPSLLGSYVAAQTFYTILFNKKPLMTSYAPNGVSQSDKQEIIQAVEHIVYNNLPLWNVGKYNPIADFNFSIKNDTIVELTNLSERSTTYQWNFGDGGISSDKAPVHVYQSSGNFDIQLIATKCNKSDTITKTITIQDLALEDYFTNKIFYNYTKHLLHYPIETITEVLLYDSFGRKVLIDIPSEGLISLDQLTRGAYIIEFRTLKGSFNYKIIR